MNLGTSVEGSGEEAHEQICTAQLRTAQCRATSRVNLVLFPCRWVADAPQEGRLCDRRSARPRAEDSRAEQCRHCREHSGRVAEAQWSDKHSTMEMWGAHGCSTTAQQHDARLFSALHAALRLSASRRPPGRENRGKELESHRTQRRAKLANIGTWSTAMSSAWSGGRAAASRNCGALRSSPASAA